MRAAVVAYLSEWVRWLSSPRRAPHLGPNPVTHRAQELGIEIAGVRAAARRRSRRRCALARVPRRPILIRWSRSHLTPGQTGVPVNTAMRQFCFCKRNPDFLLFYV
jgi:hypothetical protein